MTENNFNYDYSAVLSRIIAELSFLDRTDRKRAISDIIKTFVKEITFTHSMDGQKQSLKANFEL